MNYSDPKGSPGKEHHARLVQGLSNWQDFVLVSFYKKE